MPDIKLAPSILAADFFRLGEQVSAAINAGSEYVHIDVMDGHFVPNISFGPLVVQALSAMVKEKGAVMDVHLMIENPDQYLKDFADAGADIITVHVETCPHLHRTIQAIREFGVKPGVTLNPATPLSTLEEILPEVDLALIMSVNPGFGGQSYIPSSTGKIKQLRRMLDEIGSSADLEVDGGVKASNIAEVVGAGANVIVAGSAVYGGTSIAENIKALRKALV